MATISKLASTQYITDKHHDRNGNNIKFIIPHHMAGKMTGAGCSQYFVNNTVGTSANYCIGYDGDISCNVPEEYAAYTSGSQQADKRAITIECSDISNSNWTISDATQEALIKLMVDLYQRYPSLGGKAIFDENDASRVVVAKNGNGSWQAVKGNIIYHKWTTLSGTTCPEWHMIQIMPNIIAEVNKRLGNQSATPIKRSLFEEAQYMITNNINGQARINQAKKDGFDPIKIQGQIDLMLGKDKTIAVSNIIASLPSIAYGSNGDFVKILQQELKQMGYYNANIDGSAGNITVAAIKALQSNWNSVYKNFSVDGIFGKKSWTRLLLNK